MKEDPRMQRDIPILVVKGETLAEAYEKALIELNENGRRMSTQYDKPGDPQSIDATMNITINDPLADPMIHKAFPGGIEDLREYEM
jgi:thymidylate synthase